MRFLMRCSLAAVVVIAALGIAASASAATRSESAAVAAQANTFSVQLLARHGRGKDDPVGTEDAGCDDNGTDVCAVILAKHGADDLVDGEDDHGIDFILG